MKRDVKRECPGCGTVYYANATRLKHGHMLYCTRACSYKHRYATLRTAVVLICSVCKTEFTRPPSQIKSKHGGNFCSRACHYAGCSTGLVKRVVTTAYQVQQDPAVTEQNRHEGANKTRTKRRARDNYRHTEQTKAKLRVTTARAIADGRIPAVSRLEDEVAQVLLNIGTAFRRQVHIRDPTTGRFCALCDFVLADGRALEVNGTFWHADPRVYPDGPVHAAQRRTAVRWVGKIAALRRLGIALVVLWEYDFRKNAREAVEAVLCGPCE